MTDKLNMEKINALQHPLMAHRSGGDVWPIYDIEVQTGLVRIDVCGRLQIIDFGECLSIEDGAGDMHDTDDFYHEDEGTMADNDITEKTVWITRDGREHDTLEAANAWQSRRKIIDAIYDGITCDWAHMHAEQIATNAAALFVLLEPFFRNAKDEAPPKA